MGVRCMEHILILTHDPAGTRDWWCQTLGLREGDHPDFGFPVHWLYIGDQDVVHIGQANYSDHQDRYLANRERAGAAPDTGAIDHVCFNCAGIEEFVRRFEAAGVRFSERQANDQALFQLFVRDPINGIKVELRRRGGETRRTPAHPHRRRRQGAARHRLTPSAETAPGPVAASRWPTSASSERSAATCS
jgi:catechol 2,3-dioxygenase-like lactoylglutathione lyase family enzyme